MELETYINYTLAKKGVTQEFPGSGEFAWLKVMGKMFAMVNVNSAKVTGVVLEPFSFISLKCDPEKSLELRASHGAIKEGWHLNKKHWNTLYLDGSINNDLILELTDHAYNLVISGLTKKLKEELNAL